MENNKSVTAVEWLYERLERMIPRTSLYNMDKEDYFNQAKEMEKEQKILLVEQLKDYTKESQCILGNDEREASEFVDIFYQKYFKSE